MNTIWPSVLLLAFTHLAVCRDFYLGMFRRNDFLVAQDVIYKAPSPFGSTTASYGRLFKCPITYFRVVDRLGMGRGPITTIVRGGLKKKYITVRIKSTYRLPVSVNIYVGCENKQPSTFRTTSVTLNTALTSNAVEAPDNDGAQRITFPDSGEDDKSKTTDQTPEQDGEEGEKDTDDEKKDDDTATTVKENDDANNEEGEANKEEEEPNNEEGEE